MEQRQQIGRRGEKIKRKHMIDLLFPIALFLVLAASSLFLVILAANVYRKSVAWEESNYGSRTCLSYVTEKIRQSDTDGGVETGTFDGIPCLILRQNFGDQAYATYLYSYEGQLCELFVQEGADVHAPDGQRILEVNNFNITEQEKGIFKISCSDENGKESVTYAAVKSRG
ncbi:MAG: DUF4860 domain-containing protein [Lachnospiraceae bacterium]|jgi:hypothetical protein|nr:DUF4860 domain-containing protein [Lachnospiraceae bacterium]